MQRDMELVRDLLLWVESFPSDIPNLTLYPVGDTLTREQVQYHLGLLVQAGLLEAITGPPVGMSARSYFPSALTWAGHEFLDSARNDTIWSKVKATIGPQFATVSFTVLKELLIAAARTHYSGLLGTH